MKFVTMRNLAAVVLVVGIALFAALRYFHDAPATVLIEQLEARGSRMLGTRVDIADMSVSRKSGEVAVSTLSVANPPGFSNANMVHVERVEARGDTEARRIDSLVFQGIHALIEFQGASNNFEEVGERIERHQGRARQQQERQAAAPDDTGENGQTGEEGWNEGEETDSGEWFFERVAFNDIRVTVRADWTGEVVEYGAGDLLLEDVAGDSDEVARRTAAEFLNKVLLSAARQAGDERLRENLQEKAEDLRERFDKEE